MSVEERISVFGVVIHLMTSVAELSLSPSNAPGEMDTNWKRPIFSLYGFAKRIGQIGAYAGVQILATVEQLQLPDSTPSIN